MKVLHNVYQVLGGQWGNINNIFAVAGNSGVVLVDTAETELDLQQINQNLCKWNLGSVTHVLLTHRHYGHIANAAVLRQQGAVVIAGARDADAIESGELNAVNDFAPFPPKSARPCGIDLRVGDGQKFTAAGIEFTAWHLPGHTEGSMFYAAVLDGKQVLFTGDVLNVEPHCGGALFGWAGGEGYDRAQYFSSVKRFSWLPCDVILPGHGQLCLQEGFRILQDAYAKAMTYWRGPYIEQE